MLSQDIARKLVPCVICIMLAGASAPATAASFVKWSPAGRGLDLGAGAGVTEVSAGGSPPVVYVIVDGVGLSVSTDLGDSWRLLRGSAPCLAAPYAVAAHPADGKLVYATGRDEGSGLWMSGDAGATWTKCGGRDSGMATDAVEWISIYAEDPDLIVVGHRAGRAVSVSRDGGRSWSASDMGAEVEAQVPFIVSAERWAVASRAQNGVRYTMDGGRTWAASQGNTDYFPGPLPVIHVGDRFFSSSHHGTNKSTDAGATWSYQMERHARVVGTMGPILFREDREPIPGEKARLLTITMSDNYANTWEDVTGALIGLVPAALRANVTIQDAVDPYAHVRMVTAWSSLPEQHLAFVGLGKAGLCRGLLMRTKQGPQIVNAAADPISVLAGDSATPVTVRAMVSPYSGRLKRVYADLTTAEKGEVELLDDGAHNDGRPADRLYAGSFTLPDDLREGDKSIGIIAEDDSGRVQSVGLRLNVASGLERTTAWDGDMFAYGYGWCAPAGGFNFTKPQSEEFHSGTVALEFHCDVQGGWTGGGWNWHGWYPADAGTDIRTYRNLSFWAKVQGERVRGFDVQLLCSTYADDKSAGTAKANAADYALPAGTDLLDGRWHEVVIPLADLYRGDSVKFDAAKAWQLNFNTWSPEPAKFSIFIDEIGFDNRRVRPHSVMVTRPEARTPSPLGPEAADVAAEVDVAAEGTPISPYIYGAAMGDRAVAREMGLTMLRAGGNPVTPFNWKKGFSSKGADWFFQNEGQETTPDRTWLATFHGENRRAGLATYLTIPMMGRVAKDGTSVAFDARRYPDQEMSAGVSQPTDRLPYAGNGRQFVRGPDGEYLRDAQGTPVLRDIEPDPDDTSVEMSPAEQTDMLRFMVQQMGYGTADKGGIGVIALDNEPFLWHATHRGMRLKPCSYDELWERTRTYASVYKQVDPSVKVAAGTFFGWTAYFYSGLDARMVADGKATWEKPPDFAAHGGVPVTKWLLTKLRQHERQTGIRLADILDFHFYPQTGIYMAGTPNDPRVMEARVQETRVMWDPTWKDPSWMGAETGKVIQLIRLMKSWVAECNPGMDVALGEYNFGGDSDVSGGVAQAELLGIFGREGLDYAFYWFFPPMNSSPYFAYKMFRNPDGEHTAFGDRYLPSTVGSPEDVSVHAARDSKTGRLTFVLVNKRAAKGARIALRLSKPVPRQPLVIYEYSAADKNSIGGWPEGTAEGDMIRVSLPAMSVLRFDLKP